MPSVAIQDKNSKGKGDRPLELFKLFGTIAINNQEANKSIDETTGKAESSQSKISGSFKKVGAAVVAFFAVDKIVNFGNACLDAAANVQAMESQFTQVFGELEGQAAENLSGIAEAAGIAENRMKGSYTKIAAFAKTTGMDTADALSIADRAMVAVADSAAFYDRTLEETTESLQSFLKGNFENDAALGLSCTETTRNAAANELYGKSFKDLSESQKQLTLLKMVEDANALSGAMGQASRESNTWTNQTGNLKQAWTDFTAVIGERFLPVAIQVVAWLAEKIPEVEAFVTNALNTIGQTFSGIEPAVRRLFDAISVLWTTVLKPCLEAIWVFIRDVLAPAFTFVFGNIIVPLIERAFGNIQKAWETVLKPVFTGITDFLSGVFTQNWQQAFEGLVSIVKGVANGIIGGVEFMVNGAIKAINRLIEGLNKISSVARAIMGIPTLPTIPLLNLPRLEHGGILEKGQVGLLEGNGAEAVVPLDQNRKWISAVAKDMNGAMGSSQQTQRIIDLLEMLLEVLPDTMKDAFASMKFDVNNREFARLVKAVN